MTALQPNKDKMITFKILVPPFSKLKKQKSFGNKKMIDFGETEETTQLNLEF